MGAFVALYLFGSLLAINLLQTLSLVAASVLAPRLPSREPLVRRPLLGLVRLDDADVHRTRVVIRRRVAAHENALVIVNHQTMTDVQVLFLLARKAGRLGDLKWFVKDSLKYAPGFGWGMTFLDCLFVKRDWTADRAHIDQVFRGVVSAVCRSG